MREVIGEVSVCAYSRDVCPEPFNVALEGFDPTLLHGRCFSDQQSERSGGRRFFSTFFGFFRVFHGFVGDDCSRRLHWGRFRRQSGSRGEGAEHEDRREGDDT